MGNFFSDLGDLHWTDLIDPTGYSVGRTVTEKLLPPKDNSNSGSSGGGGGESAMETASVPSYEEMLQQQYDQMIKYSPQMQQMYYGLANQYLPKYENLAAQLRSTDRSQNMADVFANVPKFQQLERQTQGNNVYQMRGLLGDQIYSALQMGSQLTPEQARLAEQYSRSADLSRGVSMGSGSSNREAVAKALSGDALQQQRQQSAMNFGSWEQGQRYDPFASTMNMPTTAMTAAYGTFEQPFNLLQSGQNSANQQYQFQSQLAQNQANQANAFSLAQQQLNLQ